MKYYLFHFILLLLLLPSISCRMPHALNGRVKCCVPIHIEFRNGKMKMENPNRENVYERQKERRENIKENNKNYIKFLLFIFFSAFARRNDCRVGGWMDGGVWRGNGSGGAIASSGWQCKCSFGRETCSGMRYNFIYYFFVRLEGRRMISDMIACFARKSIIYAIIPIRRTERNTHRHTFLASCRHEGLRVTLRLGLRQMKTVFPPPWVEKMNFILMTL